MTDFRAWDYFFLLVFAAVVAASAFWASSGQDGELRAEIEASGVRHVMPLSTDGELVVHGPVGDTRIAVSEGAVSIVDSDCRDRICVSMGSITGASGWVACLPNRVFVRVAPVGDVTDSEEGSVDAGAF